MPGLTELYCGMILVPDGYGARVVPGFGFCEAVASVTRIQTGRNGDRSDAAAVTEWSRTYRRVCGCTGSAESTQQSVPHQVDYIVAAGKQRAGAAYH